MDASGEALGAPDVLAQTFAQPNAKAAAHQTSTPPYYLKGASSALEHLAGALVKGESVQLVGVGNFTVSNRAERSGRNPSTGEPMTIKASKAVKFTLVNP